MEGPMRLALLLICCLLPACTSVAVPETIAVEVGTGIRHETGEPVTRSDTAIIKALWRLRK